MTRCGNTGPTVPGWIRDEIARHEGTWPLAALSAGLAAVILFELVLGAALWSAGPSVVYACP